jgi:hypothetical protein
MIEEKVIRCYNSAIDKYGESDRRSILWTKDKQDMRFHLLLGEELRSSRMTLLDYGCGFSDLFLFLKKNFYNLSYNGCDINPRFVEISKNKFPDANIFHINSSDDISEPYDIILVSGTFNVLCLDDQNAMENYVFEQLSKLFDKTKYMLSVNFLSHLTDDEYRYKGHFYLDPTSLYKFAIENLTSRIVIDNASLPYETTFKFYKDTEIDYNMTIYKST